MVLRLLTNLLTCPWPFARLGLRRFVTSTFDCPLYLYIADLQCARLNTFLLLAYNFLKIFSVQTSTYTQLMSFTVHV